MKAQISDLEVDTAIIKADKVFFVFNIDQKEKWEWLGIAGGFVLSYVLIRWELNRCHIPKKQKLEALRTKLAEDSAEKPDSQV